MKARALRKMAFVLVAVSFLFVALTILLPVFKVPQTANFHGPIYPYGNSNTTLSYYYIPPIDAGTSIRVSVSEYTAGAVDMAFFPTVEGDIYATGSPLMAGTVPGRNFTTQFLSPATQPYAVFVISTNRTTFRLSVESIWSPLAGLRTYLVVGVFALMASLALLYYSNQTWKRKEQEEKIVAEFRVNTWKGRTR